MKQTLALLIALLLAPVVIADAASYYVDSVVGNDTNNGGSPDEAWRSLEKINVTTFQPGGERGHLSRFKN